MTRQSPPIVAGSPCSPRSSPPAWLRPTHASALPSRWPRSSSCTASPSRPRRRARTTTKIVLTVPTGFGIDSFVPSPGWTRQLQQTGSGEDAVIQQVTWTGGSVPTEEDSLFQFLAQPAKSGTYTFQVQQTYSDGSIVNWTGPSPRMRPRRRSRRRARSAAAARRSLGIVGLVLAIVALVLAARRCSPAAAVGSGRWRDDTGAVRSRAGCARRRSGAAGASRRRMLSREDGAFGKRRPERTALARRADLRRGGRAEIRDHLRDRRERDGRRRLPRRSARPRTPTRWSSRSGRTCPRAGTSSTGGRSRSTATPCRARSRSPSGRTPGPRRSSRSPDRADGDGDAARGRTLGRVPERDGGARALRLPPDHRPAGRAAPAGDQPAQHHARLRDRLDHRPACDSRLPRPVDLHRLAPIGILRRRARAALPGHGLRPRLRRPGDLLRPLLRRSLAGALARPARARAAVDRRASLRRSGRSLRRQPSS